MSNYRDTVRDMMKDLKTAKKSDKTSTAEKKASKKSDEEAEKTGPVPDEEDLLDEILDLEDEPIDDDEADKLLALSDNDEDKSDSQSIEKKQNKKELINKNVKIKDKTPTKVDNNEKAHEKKKNEKNSNNYKNSDDDNEVKPEEKESLNKIVPVETEKSETNPDEIMEEQDENINEKKSSAEIEKIESPVNEVKDNINTTTTKKDNHENNEENSGNEKSEGETKSAAADDKNNDTADSVLEESEEELVFTEKSGGDFKDKEIKEISEDSTENNTKNDKTSTVAEDSEIEEIVPSPKEDENKENDNNKIEDVKSDSDDVKEVTEIISDDSDNGTKEGVNSVAKKPQDKSRRDSDSSSIEMLEEFRRKSIEDEDHDEASSSSVTTTKVMKRGRGRPKSSTRKQEPETIDLSSNDDDKDEEDDDDDEDSSSDEEVDEIGDPSKGPGEGCTKPIPEDYLQPFYSGWRRELVYRLNTKNGAATQCDVYYIPPQDGRYRTREAKRKRRSKKDQERYFDDFPDDNLSTKHFNYIRKPLGLENAAYEIIRRTKTKGTSDSNDDDSSQTGRKSMKEVKESEGLLESAGSDDEEIMLINGFHPDIPITLQAFQHIEGMQAQFKQRRKYRDPETCCTPPLVEDNLWTTMDDDPFGVYTSLGGRSSPCTPPPLRSLKLTSHEAVEKIGKAFEEVRNEAFKHEMTKEIDLHEDMASHDVAIKKYKNYKSSSKLDPTWSPADKTWIFGEKPEKKQKTQKTSRPRGPRGLASSLIMRPAIDRPCTPKCPGSFGILPSMQCVICKAMFHAKCQGMISPNLRVFKCRRCMSRRSQQPLQPRAFPQTANDSSTVKLKLPMMPKNGKRPIVELVLRTPEGRYQPIKFRNNSQITETIPRSLFHKANTAKKILYVKSTQLPKLNGKPVFLAINPMNAFGGGGGGGGNSSSSIPSHKPKAPLPRPQSQQNQSDQVSILVRPQKSSANTKPVLLNVPRKVALKVKVGTTLSFSASNDQKYIVMDSKIHPAVGIRKGPSHQPQQRPSPQKRLPLPPSLTVMKTSRPPTTSTNYNSNSNRTLANLMNNKRPGLTITRGPRSTPSPSRGPSRPAKVSRPNPLPSGSNVLASGEVVSSSTAMTALQPCTPYCPGVSGFPDLECTHCQSLFHSKCVGIHQSVLERIRPTFRCRICTPVQPQGRGRPPSSSVTVIDLD